jgi:hypothetical protein
MANYLEELWDRLHGAATEEKIISQTVDAVVKDLMGSYHLAMQAEGLTDQQIVKISQTVEDAIMNNYDFLPNEEE